MSKSVKCSREIYKKIKFNKGEKNAYLEVIAWLIVTWRRTCICLEWLVYCMDLACILLGFQLSNLGI
jgi:predicted CopG family antitoxin